MGYETNNALLNLGTVALGLTYYFVRVAIYLIAYGVSRMQVKENEVAKRFKKSLFFGEIISICVEAYIEFLISGYLNMKNEEVLKSVMLGD